MTDRLALLYAPSLLDHAHHPRNVGKPTRTNASRQLDNELCGDRVTVHAVLAVDRVAEIGIEPRACLICTAAASIVSECVAHRDRASAARLVDGVLALLEGPPREQRPHDDPRIWVLTGVWQHRDRLACAALPWRAMRDVLA